MYDNWYERLKEVRKQYKFTQNDLAKLIDSDATAISRYERGDQKNISFKFLKKLERAFTRHEIDYIENGKNNSKAIAESYNTYSGRENIIGDTINSSNITQNSHNGAVESGLTAEEKTLIKYFRKRDEETQEKIMAFALTGKCD